LSEAVAPSLAGITLQAIQLDLVSTKQEIKIINTLQGLLLSSRVLHTHVVHPARLAKALVGRV